MDTVPPPMDEWKDINWQQGERNVFKLQKRIYQATQRGDLKTAHRLQRLLIKSRSAKLLATRRVTQDNRGKNTAGVDGVKTLTPPQRLELAHSLHLSNKAKPTRRVWIPKPNSTEQRPLGIPTIADRAVQALAKLALEPEWEAKFEPNSYGFRPGRSVHDAVAALYLALRSKAKYVLDADIAKCFERINHQALLHKLGTFPQLRRAVRGWLKAAVREGSELFPTEAGTPQGGVISPLLANIALHGLEAAVQAAFPAKQIKGRVVTTPLVIRYADDFVCVHPDLAVIEQVRQVVSDWLAQMGLELKPSKTRISHTLMKHDGSVGFEFLGFGIRQYQQGKAHRRKKGRRATLATWGLKTKITPSKQAVHRHWQAVRAVFKHHQNTSQAALINHLNPLVRGWSQYYSTVAASKTFARLGNQSYAKLRSWAKRHHPQKSGHWVAQKYWRLETGKWTFATRAGVRLYQYSQTHIQRHVKVQGRRSPYDGDWVYWTGRMSKQPDVPIRVASLLRRQHGRCAYCKLYFKAEDVMEVDHIMPRSQGGRDVNTNCQLLHRHCHDSKTVNDGSLKRGGADDNSQAIEEPDEVKACAMSRIEELPA